MAQKLNSFERFWQELKRRKVVHVITVYAAIAFGILQLVDIISPSLHWPDWTMTFVIVLLCIGFIIAVFVSWVYDITPAGLRKTKPVSTVKHSDHTTTPTSSGWKIATYVSGVIIVALVAFNFISRRNLNADISKLDKSIAVLPFLNESPVDSNKYFINGIMEEVLTNLQKIKEFRVLSRTSTDQYKDQDRPTIPEIARKLNVNYVVEGSGQKYGNTFRLRVQLIKAKGKETHLWGKSYEEKLRETTGLFSIQSQIAQTIATELKAIITPEEKQRIGKVSTSNMAALDLYLKANNYLKEYEKTNDSSFYQNAVDFYKAALLIDPNFAKAYTGLASAYYDRYYYPNYFKEGFLDSCLFLANKALTIDNQLNEAYYIKGVYYYENGNLEEAIDAFNEALTINPNYYLAYSYKGYVLKDLKHDYVQSIDNYNKALNLIRGDERPSLLRDLGSTYLDVGLIEKAKYYYKEALTLDKDSAKYLSDIAWLEMSLENYEEAYKLNKKFLEIDSTYLQNLPFYPSGYEYEEEAYIMAKNYVEKMKKLGVLNLVNSHRVGYVYWQIGKHNEALNYFNQQIKYGEESVKLGRYIAKRKSAQYDLAGTYAFIGNKAKAYQYLDEFNTENFYPLWWISIAKNDPLFASIRNEKRFQMILQNIEAKYLAEHERVRKWMEEQGMLKEGQ
jgi:TolB-like protein/Flp pilus assembly protein TadD